MLAGIFIGLLIYKPQMGVLIPLALIAGGHWKTFTSAALTIVCLVIASIGLFGWEVWDMFLFKNFQAVRNILETQSSFDRVQTVYGLMRVMIDSPSLAGIAQGVMSVISAVVVWFVWRKPFSSEIKGAVLVLGILLATPYVQIYEFPILTVAMLLVARLGSRNGYLKGELDLLFLAAVIPYFALLPFPIGLLSIAIVAYCVWRRARREGAYSEAVSFRSA